MPEKVKVRPLFSMNMSLTKKNTPRGYNEILQFVMDIANHKYARYLSYGSVEESTSFFLDALFKKRVSVVRYLLEMLCEFETRERETNIVTYLLSRCPEDKVKKTIEEQLQNTTISDRIKRKFLLILDKKMLSISEQTNEKIENIVSCFTDKSALADFALDSILSYMNPDAGDISRPLPFLLGHETEFYQGLIANLTYMKDEASLWLLGILAEFPNFSIAENAIAALGYRKSSLAYELLENIIYHQSSALEVRTKALSRLVQANITRSPSRLTTPHRCYLSWIDGFGNRILLLSRRTGQGAVHSRLSMVTFMLHEEKGICDCTIWNDIASSEMEELIKKLETQAGLKQIDYAYGIKVAEDSLWRVIKSQQVIPSNFLIARRIFGTQKLQPSKYSVNLSDIGIQYVHRRTTELLQASDDLWNMAPFHTWILRSQDVLDFVKNRPSLLSGRKIRKETLAQFIKIFFEAQKEKWQERFLLTADFLHKTSARSCHAQIEICLVICLAIGSCVSFSEIPYMNTLAQRSLQKAIEEISSKLTHENTPTTL